MRPVPLSSRAQAIIAELPEREDGLLFGPLGDPRQAFETAAKRVGLERVWIHLFRHLFATRLSERGAGGHDLLAAGGWSSERMVRWYTHARMQRLLHLVEGPSARAGAAAGGISGDTGRRKKKTGGQDFS